MNREERIKYLQEHQEEVNAQIKRMIEDDGADVIDAIKLLSDNNVLFGKQSITPEQWYRNHIYKGVEGENTDDEPTIEEIDLRPYLDMIRYDRIIEHMITLYIKDNKVIEIRMVDGDSGKVGAGKEKYTAELMHAKELGAKVYQVHNHPQDFIAKPSKGDILYNKGVIECANNIGVEIADIGVVTIDDYYSYKKSLDK